MSAAVVGLCALALTVVATPLAMAAARRAGAVDRPGPLKPQAAAVPNVGGVAVFVGLLPAVAAGHPWTVLPLAAALALGVVDDRRDLPPWVRLAVQLAIGVAVALALPVHVSRVVAVPVVAVATPVLINGVNLLDGADLLASGVVGTAALGFALLLGGDDRLLAAGVVGALVGFAVYNRPPARVYLGDGGSYLLGTALAVLLVSTWSVGTGTGTGVAGAALVAIPVGEIAGAVVRRSRGHLPLFAGDRGHPYDRLLALGWSRGAVAGCYVGAQAVLVAVTVTLGHHASVPAAVVLDVAVGAAVLVAVAATGSLRPCPEVTR